MPTCVSVVLHLGGLSGFKDARTPDVPNMTNSDIYNDSAHINEWCELNEKIIRKWFGFSDNRRFVAINDGLWSR